MISTRKRGTTYHVDYVSGSARVRGSLGTSDWKAAQRLCNRLGFALADGPTSKVWDEIQPILPADTFRRFSAHAGVARRGYTWDDLQSIFWTESEKSWAAATAKSHARVLKVFGEFLEDKEIFRLTNITSSVIEAFREKRDEDSSDQKQFRNGAGVEKDIRTLSQVFKFAVENEMIEKNPVKKQSPQAVRRITQPFTAEDLVMLQALATPSEKLVILLLLWTGLRGSDAVDLRWGEIYFDAGEIRRKSIKTGAELVIPLQSELSSALWFGQGIADFNARVLGGIATTRPQLYNLMSALGKRAGVPDCRPHRFRDTLAVHLLLKGGTMYDVAKILGNTVAVAEKHYTPFVPELRDRLRNLLEAK